LEAKFEHCASTDLPSLVVRQELKKLNRSSSSRSKIEHCASTDLPSLVDCQDYALIVFQQIKVFSTWFVPSLMSLAARGFLVSNLNETRVWVRHPSQVSY
ncbi:8140_t:CDS:2, partial [Scutellospora calospora]